MNTPAPPAADEPRSPDRIGRRRFLIGAGAAAGAAAMSAAWPSTASALPAGASQFVPLTTAIRVADTREPGRFPVTRIDGRRIRIPLRGRHGVSDSASAVVITVTAVNGTEGNYVSVFPSGGAVPFVSNLNLLNAGEVTANLASVKLGSTGEIDVLSLAGCHMIVDVLGFYEPTNGATRAGRFVGLDNARRAIDTRELPSQFAGGYVSDRSYTSVDVTDHVPPDASSVVINLTATECVGPSFFSALPGDAPESAAPTTSTLNVSRPGQTRAASAIVPVSIVGGRRTIKIYTQQRAKIIVDIVGSFTSDTSPSSEAGLFVPLDPDRLLDTREPNNGDGKLWPFWVVEVAMPSHVAANASAVVVNVTGVESRAAGFLTVTGARQPITLTSNLNFTGPWEVVPNHVVTPVTATHGMQVYASDGCHVVVDLAGYYTGTPKAPSVPKYLNPPPPTAPPEWTLHVPKLGLWSRVLEGDPGWITNHGHSWHWSGTGYMGQENAHVALFAHRTDAGGPYRHLNDLRVGDVWTIRTADAREYTYRMVRRDLTDWRRSNILDATRFHPGTTLSLVACTVGHDRSKSRWPDVWAPTSLDYRIVVTGELVSWRET